MCALQKYENDMQIDKTDENQIGNIKEDFTENDKSTVDENDPKNYEPNIRKETKSETKSQHFQKERLNCSCHENIAEETHNPTMSYTNINDIGGIIKFDPVEHQHIRYNPLKGEWVLVSPHRMKRPWTGQVELNATNDIAEYDSENPLCPGNIRANGKVNPNYRNTFSFVNDFPALLESVPSPPNSNDELFKMDVARGTCKVLCYHPKMNVTIALMKVNEIKNVIEQWICEMNELGKKWIWVQIFENRGALMGCSNPHPHCQIWASSFLPHEAEIKDKFLCDYYRRHGKPLLIDYMQKELLRKERIVIENCDWVVIVPFWAVWPYETIVLPKTQVVRMQDLTTTQQESLAYIMKRLCTRYDNLFQCSFPYSMGWHGAPTGLCLDKDYRYWTFHGLYFPPLLRSATVKKHMVGYELLAQVQRDLTPEQAAQVLRNLSDVHYKYPETSLPSDDPVKYCVCNSPHLV